MGIEAASQLTQICLPGGQHKNVCMSGGQGWVPQGVTEDCAESWEGTYLKLLLKSCRWTPQMSGDSDIWPLVKN